MSVTIIELDRVPDAASEDDKWVDTFDGRKLYVAKVTYGLTISSLTIPAVDRPGSVDLVFSAIAAGGDGDLIDIIINNAGPTGTSTLVKSGTGTPADHFLFTFSMFEDDSSNDRIITLLSGDPDITASGADATTGAFNSLDQVSLIGAIVNWRPVNIHLEYVAELPEIIDTTLDLDRSIPFDIKKFLAEKLAARLLEIDEGGDKNLANRLEQRYEQAVGRSAKHRARLTAPNDLHPG